MGAAGVWRWAAVGSLHRLRRLLGVRAAPSMGGGWGDAPESRPLDDPDECELDMVALLH